MARPLQAIVAATHENIIKGLNGTSQKPWTFRQLTDDIVAERAAIIKDLQKSGRFDPVPFTQRIKVDKPLLVDAKDSPILKKAFKFDFPLPMVELGDACFTFGGPQFPAIADSYKIEIDDNIRNLKNSQHANRPVLWMDMADRKMEDDSDAEHITGWLFNAKARTPLAFSVILADPRTAPGHDINITPFPCSGKIERKIIDNISQRYIYFYRGGSREAAGLTPAQTEALRQQQQQQQQQQDQ